jgi:hypothetical protein
VERLENREKSENEEPWQEPYDLRENLTGSVICLDKTLNTVMYSSLLVVFLF